ncbi:hypothetical protein AB0B56_11650 [Streptosporangium canum]|uniref:hypothetical protein n=1 Tax=Streptosporangium canum TaxID=324952 RepID=UPI003414B8B4
MNSVGGGRTAHAPWGVLLGESEEAGREPYGGQGAVPAPQEGRDRAMDQRGPSPGAGGEGAVTGGPRGLRPERVAWSMGSALPPTGPGASRMYRRPLSRVWRRPLSPV